MHELIDGELDVDRTDDLLRDACAYGFDYVTFELDRLVDNVAAAETVRAQEQAAAESFFFARFRMYQWGVFHHKVVQVGSALQHLIHRRLDGATGDEHALNDFLRHLALLADDRPGLRQLPNYDDVWWTAFRTACSASPRTRRPRRGSFARSRLRLSRP